MSAPDSSGPCPPSADSARTPPGQLGAPPPPAAAHRRAESRLLRPLRNLLLLLAGFYLVSETASFALYRVTQGDWFSFARTREAMRVAAITPADAAALKVVGLEVPFHQDPHPYFGFGRPPGFDFLAERARRPPDPGTVTVALVGGSVTYNLYQDSRDVLARALSEVPALRGRKVQVVLLGWYAWKQPQQLAAVAYYLAMGGRFDILLELDGRNEIVDAMFNYGRHVFPAYPWLWVYLSSRELTMERAQAIGKLSFLRFARRRTALACMGLPASVSAGFAWTCLDAALARQVAGARAQLAEVEIAEGSMLPEYRSGPRREPRTEAEALALFATIWRDSSLQLSRLASANRALYFHFLQPSLHVPGKPFSAEERKLASTWRPPGMPQGYPLLLAAGRDLQRRGVRFTSLTSVFDTVPDTLYVDDCHVNRQGSDLLARAMARTVGAWLGSHPLPSPGD